MARYGRWETEGKPLGKGGQGVVYRARDTSSLNLDSAAGAIVNAVRTLAGDYASGPERNEIAANLARRILDYAKEGDPAFCGALKVLHPAENQDEYKKQLGRMKYEVDALSKMTHPNVARIFDANLDQHWFVMDYFSDKTLTDHMRRFTGDLFRALTAIRPLVEGVAEIHRNKLVHRDIKPENVFVSASRGLVLADFGLVFFTEDNRSRVSETYENVGSRDWMPGWAMGMLVEDIRPSFDVFCLGKLLWSMASGKRKLRLWYHHQDEFELEKMFPGDPEIWWARTLLDRCIVEHEKDCLPDEEALLREIDTVLGALRRKGQVVSDTVVRTCRVCGLGNYQDVTGREFAGLTGPGGFRIFLCSHCRHAEFFSQGEFPVTFRG
jgi:serine/threonine protein kinase